MMKRRDFVSVAGTSLASLVLAGCGPNNGNKSMYGLIGQMFAVPGKGDALIAILLGGTKDMPGCLSYVVSKDSENEDALWITEIWDSQESHAASLSLPAVQLAIGKGKPMISGFGQRFETTPVGGHGIGDL